MSEVTDLQSKIIDLILEGHKITDIAKETGVRRTQIYRWLDREEFKAELETRRAQLRKSARDKITGQVNVLADEMLKMALNSTDQRVKLQAIKYLLDRSLGIPTAAKEDKIIDDSKKVDDGNTLKKELDDIKKLKVVK